MSNSFSDFSNTIRKVNEPRDHLIKNSLKQWLYYQWYNKTKPNRIEYNISRSQHSEILSMMFNGVVDNLISNKKVLLPLGFGTVSIMKRLTRVEILDDGSIFTTRQVNMAETLKLWYNDHESMENKKLIRFDGDYRFRILYNKSKSNCKNIMYFNFRFCRNLKYKLKERILTSDYDTYELT